MRSGRTVIAPKPFDRARSFGKPLNIFPDRAPAPAEGPMRLIDYLDKGASLGSDAPCLTMDGRDHSYGEVRGLSYRIAKGLVRSGVEAGEKVAILSGNDPIAFAC